MISSLARGRHYKWYAFATLAVGIFASVVDHGSVGVALPTIATHFQTDIPSVQWLVIGYAMTIIALLLPMGRLADIITSKRVYIIGSAVTIAGSIAAGTSSDLGILIISRIVQGTGAAMTQGTGMAIMIGAFPPNERGKAIGLIMTMVGTGAVAGPAMGGFPGRRFRMALRFLCHGSHGCHQHRPVRSGADQRRPIAPGSRPRTRRV